MAVYPRHRDRCLLVLHRRLGVWLPPGGECEPGEAPLEAARRELYEETGLQARFPVLSEIEGTPPGLIGYEEHIAGSKGWHLNFVFVADVDTDEVRPCDEFSAWRWVDSMEGLHAPPNVGQLLSVALSAGKGPRLIEVSHPIEPGMRTYPGLPAPRAEVLLSYEDSRARYGDRAEFLIASLHLCGNTGTYVDAPIHRHREGVDLAGLPLARLAHVPALVVDARGAPGRGIGPEVFAGAGQELRGRAVLVRTDASLRFGTEAYFEPNPFLTREACAYLLAQGPALVGIDAVNIDDMEDLSRPAHTLLLGAGIPICEHLRNLAAVPTRGGFLHAVPIAWRGGATFPVRAYVMFS